TQQRPQRGEYRRHAARGGKRRRRALDQAQSFLEHRDGRVAVAGVHVAVHLTGERLLRLRRGPKDIAGGQVHRFGGLFELRAQHTAAHSDGGLADTVRQRRWRANRTLVSHLRRSSSLLSPASLLRFASSPERVTIASKAI